MWHAKQRSQQTVTTSLFDNARAGIHQHDCQIHVGCSGNHVAGVLNVARAIGDDEVAIWCRKVAVGNVDGDALLALSAQAIGQQ